MKSLTLIALPCAFLMTGCDTAEPRFDAPVLTAAAAPLEKVASRYARIEIVSVTLPSYAQAEEIYQSDADGAILPLGPLWSDEPGRAITQQVARDLDVITGRLVAPEPWPFRGLPDVRVDIRVQDFYATTAGQFRLSGQYFVAPEEFGPDRARQFDILTPIGGEAGPGAIAAARNAAVSELAGLIARNGLR